MSRGGAQGQQGAGEHPLSMRRGPPWPGRPARTDLPGWVSPTSGRTGSDPVEHVETLLAGMSPSGFGVLDPPPPRGKLAPMREAEAEAGMGSRRGGNDGAGSLESRCRLAAWTIGPMSQGAEWWKLD